MIKQIIPQEVCLKCQGCCRFKEANSVWLPCLLDEEIQDLLDRDIPAAAISRDRKILPEPEPKGEGFRCAFFNPGDNKCKIYDFRPLECQLYPFLISLQARKVFLTVDPNCPYIRENLGSKELKQYTDYLNAFLNAPAQIKLLKDNPQLIQAYEDVLNLAELNF